jgi:hypothetical protein
MVSSGCAPVVMSSGICDQILAMFDNLLADVDAVALASLTLVELARWPAGKAAIGEAGCRKALSALDRYKEDVGIVKNVVAMFELLASPPGDAPWLRNVVPGMRNRINAVGNLHRDNAEVAELIRAAMAQLTAV